ncbi:zinc-ribbon domain-containing protein [Vibrio gangliei]|uniref:zinc-ribbon domain-containing protein n=1 Tax=Vibrio gangliei TaxID=2077090 RepID=UPI000D020948
MYGKTSIKLLSIFIPNKLDADYSDENTRPPNEVKHSDKTLRIWCCNKGHKWKETVNSRVARLKDETYGADCLYCKHCAVYGSLYLGENRPDLLELWDYSKNTIDPMTLIVMDTDVHL